MNRFLYAIAMPLIAIPLYLSGCSKQAPPREMLLSGMPANVYLKDKTFTLFTNGTSDDSCKITVIEKNNNTGKLSGAECSIPKASGYFPCDDLQIHVKDARRTMNKEPICDTLVAY